MIRLFYMICCHGALRTSHSHTIDNKSSSDKSADNIVKH